MPSPIVEIIDIAKQSFKYSAVDLRNREYTGFYSARLKDAQSTTTRTFPIKPDLFRDTILVYAPDESYHKMPLLEYATTNFPEYLL